MKKMQGLLDNVLRGITNINTEEKDNKKSGWNETPQSCEQLQIRTIYKMQNKKTAQFGDQKLL